MAPGRKRKLGGPNPQAHGRIPPKALEEIKCLAAANGMLEGTLTGHLIISGLASLHKHGDSVKALLEAEPRAPEVGMKRPFPPRRGAG